MKQITLFTLSLIISLYGCNVALAENIEVSGKPQNPFICKTVEAGLGEPIIDNINKEGMAIHLPGDNKKVIGYSKNCYVIPKIEYYYKSNKDNKFHILPATKKYPKDLARTSSGAPFIVKLDRGTLNRFLYMMAVLEDPIQNVANKNYAWNKKLVYYFAGGVGAGFMQAGGHSLYYIKDFSNLLQDIDFLSRGYAVVFSTGTATSTHYNLQLGLNTAQLLKRHFIKSIGEPKFTIGFGKSGGAIQSYVYSEQDPDLLDGAITAYSYPDMVTQISHVGDCELLEHYFDKQQQAWDWNKRQLIEGMYSSNDMPVINKFAKPEPSKDTKGCSSCINGWRGTVPFMLNPHFNPIPELQKQIHPHGVSHFEDLSENWQFGVYPRNNKGVTPHTFDNEGVQYGLKALMNKQITKQEFFDLNKNIGGWKPTELLVKERGYPFGTNDKTQEFNPWSYQNMYQSNSNNVAPRSKIDYELQHIVKNSGIYFSGKTNIPIIDWRPYLDRYGDMHFAYGSFMARARIIRENQQYDNHVIWVTDTNNKSNNKSELRLPKNNKQLEDALTMMDEWLTNIEAQKFGNAILANKPKTLEDGCFDNTGNSIYIGKDAWNGIIDKEAKGTCAMNPNFQIFSTSRINAGEELTGDTLKCNLVPVEEFFAAGKYEDSDINTEDISELKTIFPTGVCG